MNTRKIYVPVLKWQEGEQIALKNLFEEQKDKIIPLIELTEEYSKEIFFESLISCFPHPIYLDTIIANEDRGYLLSILEYFKSHNKEIYPVIYFYDIDEISNNIKEYCNRVAVRVPIPEDIDGPNYDSIFNKIKDLYNTLNLEIDLILDLGIMNDKNDVNRQLSELKSVLISSFFYPEFYNSIIICSSSFPKNLSNIEAGNMEIIKRYEVLLFRRIFDLESSEHFKNKLIYSDYGVTKFTGSELDFSKIGNKILPKVKYTTNDFYYILKGKRNISTGILEKTYVDLAKEIISSEYYFGKDFSFGDLEIYERANNLNKKGPGNHKNWVAINTNHHIAVVVEQLSKMF